MMIIFYIIVLIVNFFDPVNSTYIVDRTVPETENFDQELQNANIMSVSITSKPVEQSNNLHHHNKLVDTTVMSKNLKPNKFIKRPQNNLNHELMQNLIASSSMNSVSKIEKTDYLSTLGLSPEGKLKCKTNTDCLSVNKEMYCDKHYGYCRELSREGELCRTDEHCGQNTICIFGKCLIPKEVGKSGSRCVDDSDCDTDYCCARLLGHKICKPKLKLNQRCFIPYGGLDYSLNESCSCVEGLSCQPIELNHHDPTSLRNSKPNNPKIEHLRCTI